MRFTRKDRLTTQAEFSFVFARPGSSRDRYFRVLSRPNELGRCRLGMAVSRKVSQRAVDRNRLKRLIRESFRAHMEELAKRGGFDYVVLPMPPAASICNRALEQSLQRLWFEAVGGTDATRK